MALTRALAHRGRVVVALSGSGVGRELAVAAGAAAFLEKDTHAEALLAALQRLA